MVYPRLPGIYPNPCYITPKPLLVPWRDSFHSLTCCFSLQCDHTKNKFLSCIRHHSSLWTRSRVIVVSLTKKPGANYWSLFLHCSEQLANYKGQITVCAFLYFSASFCPGYHSTPCPKKCSVHLVSRILAYSSSLPASQDAYPQPPGLVVPLHSNLLQMEHTQDQFLYWLLSFCTRSSNALPCSMTLHTLPCNDSQRCSSRLTQSLQCKSWHNISTSCVKINMLKDLQSFPSLPQLYW